MMARPNPLKPGERTVYNIGKVEWQPYLRDGKPFPKMKWAPLSTNSELRRGGRYLLRLEPGAMGPLHQHGGGDEFYVVEGSIHDSDGTILRAGDYAVYQKGSVHWTDAPEGCTLIVTFVENSILLDEK
jgi:anti-sigma factor ChrR (cupin superfamily)